MMTHAAHRQQGQRGYAYLLVMFLLALLIVGTMAVVPNVLIEGRREQEKEMIWRGEQYKRAIRLYVSHRTNASHRLPTSLEDLVKGVPGVHFLRQAYKDPMNKKDGSWRLIYVGPSGQLIGSTRPPGQNLAIPGFGTPAALSPSAGLQQNQSSFNNSPNGPLSLSTQSAPTGIPVGGSQPAQSSDTNSSSSTSRPEVPPDGVTLVGGNIIGIGSKVNQKSIIWFEKAKNYRQFEFIWDPSKDAAIAAQPATGAVLPGQPGATNSFGQPAQTNPPANPPAPPANPPGTGGGNPAPPPGTGGNPSPPPGTPPPNPD